MCQNVILRWLLLAAVLLALPARAERARSPFGVTVTAAATNVAVQFTVPAGCVLYSERLHFETADGADVPVLTIPPPVTRKDPITGHDKTVYAENFTVTLASAHLPWELAVRFQGCTNAECYFPEQRRFPITAPGPAPEVRATEPAPPATDSAPGGWLAAAKGFKVLGTQTGYQSPADFIAFLDRAVSGQGENDPLAAFRHAGLALTLLLILLGGVGLNLTPCVLPLIPVNLAIIGAGKSAANRAEGFWRGAAYGAGMALTYGSLGLFVVLTGSKFGTLNSSPWFNVTVAVVFAVLALAMFGKFNLDFSRFEGSLGGQVRGMRRRGLVAFGLGVLAALLAGACVAPVVISVLLLAADFYAKGMVLGLALPFLLGLGMALPWPFAGASLALLPKPGAWMERVKQGFGVLILVFAAYYGWLAAGLFHSAAASTRLGDAPAGIAGQAGDPDQELLAGLQQAQSSGRPVFIDFQASWCKNCAAMEETVFNRTDVQKRLGDFVVVKYRAERPNEAPARDVLDHFGALGLPTYVVLAAPVTRPAASPTSTPTP